MAGNTILVVDDEQRMRKLVRDFLTKQNFRVLEAADGEEAVDVFMENKDIVLVILDVMMPKMDGWETCREIRQGKMTNCVALNLGWTSILQSRLVQRF